MVHPTGRVRVRVPVSDQKPAVRLSVSLVEPDWQLIGIGAGPQSASFQLVDGRWSTQSVVGLRL